jgi:hypothetical protein
LKCIHLLLRNQGLKVWCLPRSYIAPMEIRAPRRDDHGVTHASRSTRRGHARRRAVRGDSRRSRGLRTMKGFPELSRRRDASGVERRGQRRRDLGRLDQFNAREMRWFSVTWSPTAESAIQPVAAREAVERSSSAISLAAPGRPSRRARSCIIDRRAGSSRRRSIFHAMTGRLLQRIAAHCSSR